MKKYKVRINVEQQENVRQLCTVEKRNEASCPARARERIYRVTALLLQRLPAAVRNGKVNVEETRKSGRGKRETFWDADIELVREA